MLTAAEGQARSRLQEGEVDAAAIFTEAAAMQVDEDAERDELGDEADGDEDLRHDEPR